MIYDMTLAENVRYGQMSASPEQIRAAAEQAGVMKFADNLPDGLNAMCGENGAKLSGGQKQRISLARAFLRDPGLLLLDEPTSALDAKSESEIQDSLKKLMTGRTAIVIAHRLSLVRDLDMIVVIDQGRITEIGNHEALMVQKGQYYRLYCLQFDLPMI